MKFLSLLMLVPFVAWSETGGITGGGGGVENPTPVDVQMILEAVKNGKRALHGYANGLKYNWLFDAAFGKPSQPPYDFLFDRPDDVFTYLDSVKIEVRENSPCRTDDGRETDGSVSPSRPNVICISAFNLSKKLYEFNYESETMALIFHEILHLMGGSEELALRMQRAAIYPLQVSSPGDLQPRTDRFLGALWEITDRLTKFRDRASFSSPPSSEQYSSVLRLLMGLQEEFMERTFLPLLKGENRISLIAHVQKYNVMEFFACSLDPAIPADSRDWCKNFYERGFAADTELLLDEYIRRRDGNGHPFYRSTFVTKIESDEDWRNELQEILDALERFKAYAVAFRELSFPVEQN